MQSNFEAVWFHEVIADALTRALYAVKNKQKARIILCIPPRTGKTQLASIHFPAWALGKYPDLRFILSTYGSDLSEKVGQKARDEINDEKYQQIFPGVKLRQDTKAKARWMTKHGGEFNAVGIGSAVTGTGADCLTGDTLIETEHGIFTLATLFQLCYNGMVKSFNHITNEIEYKHIRAYREIKNKKVFRINTSRGGSITATRDHKFYTLERGYTPLEKIRVGDNIIINKDFDNLQKVWKKNHKTSTRDKKSTKEESERSILWKRVRGEGSRNKKQKEVSDLWIASTEENQNILRKFGMQENPFEIKRYHLSCVSKTIPSTSQKIKILFTRLQEFVSLRRNETKEKSKLQTWNGTKQISKRIQNNKKQNNKKRCWLCNLWNNRILGRASQGLQSAKQYIREFSNRLSFSSQDTSCLQIDTISSIEELEKETVYDIQVEGNNNFFANGILVHNCILLDDPHKDRKEAESQVQRETVWEYYRSTLYSRLEGFGAVIVIMQRWHDDDLVGRLLEDSKKKKEAGEPYDEWEIINFPAIAIEDEKYRKAGEALWPNKFPIPVLENIRSTLGNYNWISQYMQDPILAETQEFQESMFKIYKQEDIENIALRYYTVVDPAISQKQEADNTVVLTVAKEIYGPNVYRIREDAGHYTPKQTQDLVFKHQAEYRSEVFIETVAYQKALKYNIEEEQRRRNTYFTINEIKSTTNKEIKIRGGLLPMYENGVIYHKATDRDYEHELLTFPRGKHDDRIDAMAMAVTEALQNTRSGRSAKQFRPTVTSYFTRHKR